MRTDQIFSQVLLIDPMGETVLERRLDVSQWPEGGLVRLHEDDCTPRRRQHQGPTPSHRMKIETMRKAEMISWRVFPLMQPAYGDDPYKPKIGRTGKWVAFRQGFEPRKLQRDIKDWRIVAWVAIIGLALSCISNAILLF